MFAQAMHNRTVQATSPSRIGGCRAALLLEVVLSLAIVVAAMGVLGAQLISGLRLTANADEMTRAAALTDRLLALVELDPKLQEQIAIEQQTDGDFGDSYRGWLWRMQFEPTEVAGLSLIRAEVYYDATSPQSAAIERAKLVRTVTLLKAAPGRINLVQDFGMEESKVAELATALPIPDFDPTNVDPQALMQFATENPELLLELVPALLPLLQQFASAGGAGARGPGELASLGRQLGELGGELGGGTPEEQLEALMRLGGAAAAAGAPGGPAGVGAGPAGGGPAGIGAPGAAPAGEGRSPAGRRGGTRRGGNVARGGQPPSQPPPGEGAQPQYTLEDLMRLRDQMEQGGP